MAARRSADYMHVRHPYLILISLITAGALAFIALTVVHGARAVDGRRQLLDQLQRPATPTIVPGVLDVAIRRGGYRVALTISPNRANGENRLALRLSRNGRPIRNARLTVVFSMPAMNMWAAFTSALAPTSSGTYRANEPVLGMAGIWRLRIHGGAPRRPAFTASVNDHMGG